jgi:purine-binding chemotaxis protein CheW
MNTVQGATKLAQYLTFQLAEQDYAIAIMQVREIVEYRALTRIPRTPGSIRGVINLRGNVVPVIDLSLILQVPSKAITARTCVIVVEVNCQEERAVIGIIADAVSKVVQWSNAEILSTPAFGAGLRVDFLTGMAKAAEKFVMLLDLDRALSITALETSTSFDDL